VAKLREQPKNIELAIRARKMARMLDGRIYVCKDGVYLIEGKPKLNKLLHCLQSIDQVPEPGKEPGPIQLGFTPTQIKPVTKELLADLGRALQKWRKVITEKNLRKPKKSSTRKELRRWKEEVDFLCERFDCLHTHLKTFIADSNQPTKYIPADTYHLDISEAVHFLGPSRHVPALWQWYGLIVAWISGSKAVTRFLSALQPILLSPSEQRKVEWARHIHQLFIM